MLNHNLNDEAERAIVLICSATDMPHGELVFLRYKCGGKNLEVHWDTQLNMTVTIILSEGCFHRLQGGAVCH